MLNRSRDDTGLTLVETMVAMAVFAIAATALLSVLVRTTEVAGSNNRRVVAAGLANKAIESVRGSRALDIPNGLQTRTETVGGTVYTIRQTATFVVNGATTSVCAASGNTLSYKLVTVTVSWPRMGAVTPVRVDTLKSLGLGADGLSATQGSVAVSVTGASGAAVSGIPVVLTPGGQSITTGDDGCALFTGLTPGAYTATVDLPGYVGTAGARRSGVASLGVSANQITRAGLVYDTTRALQVSWSSPNGVAPAATVPLLVRSSYLTARTLPPCSAVTSAPQSCQATAGVVQDLFPATYEVWGGACSDAVRPVVSDLTPSGPGDAPRPVSVPLAGLHVDVLDPGGLPVPGQQVYAVHPGESLPPGAVGCATGESHALGAGPAGGLDAALPFGTWRISTVPGAPDDEDRTTTVTLSPGEGVTTVALEAP